MNALNEAKPEMAPILLPTFSLVLELEFELELELELEPPVDEERAEGVKEPEAPL